MGSTRQTPLLQIYQDVEPSFDHEHGIYAESHAHPLQPMGNASFKKNVIFDRPLTGLGEPSPSKPTFASSASPSRHPMNNRFNLISIPPPQETTAISDSPVKNSTYTTFNGPTIHKPQKVLFSTFPSSKGNDKENRAPPAPSSENFAEFPDPVASQRSSAKRALLEAPVLRDRAAKRPKKEEDASYQLPEPAEMPQIRDDGSKPPYSYATLIGMAILRAPNRRLTLAQIYKWISETFGYYHNSETGWQNSIRHNLSLNKAFVKQERPKDDPGKGNYWAIEPGMEGQFLKDKLARRPVSLGMSANPSSKKQSSETPSQRDGRTERRLSLDHEVKVREELELSSDATLPASDPAFNEPDILGEPNMPPPTSRHIHSSPPQLIHSSPPVPHHSAHQETSPPGESYPSSSQETRSRKRKLAAMNDSGYFSSIESSASRPLPARNILTSEADIDRPHTKRGRAEEEIARIRQSSHDSPTVTRGLLRQPSHPLMSSSPLRHFDSSLMLPPFTPVAALKLPPRPPLSVSPNTNLRNHRNKIKQLVGSPVRNLGILNDEIPWSPAFTIDDDSYNLDEYRNGLQGDLEIFADNAEDILAKAPHLSPTKMSIKRPRLDRMHTTPNILAEGTKRLEHSVSPILGLRSMSTSQSPYKDFSPSKPYSFDTSILDLTQEDMFDGDLFEDAPGLEDGVDILQGFQKIGKGKDENKITTTKVRPKLGSVGRSFTSRF